jgi:hypothetical protein
MPICGLSNQWRTYDDLINRFASLPPGDDPIVEKYRMIRRLLAELHQSAEGTIYVGTSHSLMNFGTRDVVSDDDSTPSFAYVDVRLDRMTGEYFFRTVTREIDRERPTTEWGFHDTKDEKIVADLLVSAFRYAEAPILRVHRHG